MAQVTYYWNSWGGDPIWLYPGRMIDNDLGTFGYTSSTGDTQLLNGNTCPGTELGEITDVEVRPYAYGDGGDYLDMLFDLFDIFFQPGTEPGWSMYWSIFTTWYGLLGRVPTFADVQALTNSIRFRKSGKANQMNFAKAEVRVTYTPPSAYPFHRRTLKGAGPYSGRRGFDEATGHRRGFWP